MPIYTKEWVKFNWRNMVWSKSKNNWWGTEEKQNKNYGV